MLPMILTLALVAQAPEAADDTRDFDALIADAMSAHKAGSYVDAAADFEKAYAIKPEPRLMYNIARCYEKAPDLDRAIDRFETFLSLSGTTAELRAKARASLSALRGEQAALNAPPPPPPPVEAPPAAAPPPPAAATGPRVVAPVRPEPRSRTLEWLLIGGGVAAAGTGAVFGFLALNEQDRFRQADASGRDAAENAGRRNALLADLLIGGGIVSAAIGTLLLFLGDDEPAASVNAAVTADGGQLVIGGHF